MSQDETLLSFPEGIIGFPEYTTYRLLEPQGAYPLKFLQAVEAPEISFACMDAVAIQQDYQVPLSEAHHQVGAGARKWRAWKRRAFR